MPEPASIILDQRREQGFPDGDVDPRVWDLIDRITVTTGGTR